MPGQHVALLDSGVETKLERGVPAHLTCSIPRPTDNTHARDDVSGRVITIGGVVINIGSYVVPLAHDGSRYRDPICPTPPGPASPTTSSLTILVVGGCAQQIAPLLRQPDRSHPFDTL